MISTASPQIILLMKSTGYSSLLIFLISLALGVTIVVLMAAVCILLSILTKNQFSG
jgi:hypothetical protein